jgi:hypothetical protein
MNPPRRYWFAIKLTLIYTFWALPVGACGCLLMVLPPLGLLIIGCAAWPVARAFEKRSKEVWEWRNQPDSLSQLTAAPWTESWL